MNWFKKKAEVAPKLLPNSVWEETKKYFADLVGCTLYCVSETESDIGIQEVVLDQRYNGIWKNCLVNFETYDLYMGFKNSRRIDMDYAFLDPKEALKVVEKRAGTILPELRKRYMND